MEQLLRDWQPANSFGNFLVLFSEATLLTVHHFFICIVIVNSFNAMIAYSRMLIFFRT